MALPASALARESRDSARGLLDEAALPGSVMDASLLRLLDFTYKARHDGTAAELRFGSSSSYQLRAGTTLVIDREASNIL